MNNDHGLGRAHGKADVAVGGKNEETCSVSPTMIPPRFLRMVLPLALTAPFTGRAADGDWSAYLGDAGSTQYSTLRQIDRGNVAQLEPAWTYRTGDATENSQIQCNPLIVDGILYGTSAQLKLFALDAATGRELWRFDPFAAEPATARGRGVNRGVALWREGADLRLLFVAGHHLLAVDARTGRLIPSFGEAGRVDLRQGLDRDITGLSFGSTTPGSIYRDLIIVPTRVGEGPGPAAPGHIRAFDVRTGQRRWIFHTIPHPGEFGYDTWPPHAWQDVGGANCWAGLTIDQESGTAFVPTGSASFDFWGGNRVGANLFANCLLALDAATGERKWHFQFIHHDLWDWDLPAPPVLCTVTRNGKKIAAVALATKTGHVWAFDRETGESLFPWHEVPVPPSDLGGEVAWPTQPFPLQPAPFARQVFTEDEVTNRTPAARAAVQARLRAARPHQPFDPPSERGTVVLPGFNGGAEWGGTAVDPNGVLYVNSSEMAWLLHMVPAKTTGTTAGGAIYRQLCTACHGLDRAGNAAHNIPSLIGLRDRLQPADIVSLLQTGRGVMPAFAFLTEVQKRSLAGYLLGLEPAADETVEPAADARSGSPYVTTGYNRFLDPDGYPALRPPWGTLNAVDLNTGEYLWQRPLGEVAALTRQGIPPTGTENYGGPIVTAGGLLFIAATHDEKFRAFDTKTGELLWQTDLPAGGYATPATYLVEGRQYVVIASGGGKMGTKSGDAYVAFALPEVAPRR